MSFSLDEINYSLFQPTGRMGGLGDRRGGTRARAETTSLLKSRSLCKYRKYRPRKYSPRFKSKSGAISELRLGADGKFHAGKS